jgi:hypothetical protein
MKHVKLISISLSHTNEFKLRKLSFSEEKESLRGFIVFGAGT